MSGADFMREMNRADDCRKKKQYKSAIKYFEELIEEFPEHTMVSAYNLGTVYHTELGYGEKAKECYLKVIAWHESKPNYRASEPKARKTLDTILANAYENLMLVSDSFEEFYSWGEKLRAINPKADVLHENLKDVQKAEQRGLDWEEVYFETAQLFWDTDPAKDRGLYGFGASIYRRMLRGHRRENRTFRLNRQMYSYCANGYGGLMLMIVARMGKDMESALGRVDVDEVAFIFEDAVGLLKEYSEKNEDDDRVRNCIGQLEETLARMKTGKTGGRLKASTSSKQVEPKAFSFVGTVLGLALIYYLQSKGMLSGWGWYVLGFFGGSFVGSTAAYIAKGGGREILDEPGGKSGKTQFNIGKRDLEWQKGNDLLRAAGSMGFSNTAFKLDSAGINPQEGTLDLYFAVETHYDRSVEHQIGLALRCVVARTLGIAAAATNGVFVAEPMVEYNIKLGNGLPAEGFSLMTDNRGVGPMQCTSREMGDRWLVQVKPFQMNMERYMETIQQLNHVFSKMVPTFEGMRDLRIRF